LCCEHMSTDNQDDMLLSSSLRDKSSPYTTCILQHSDPYPLISSLSNTRNIPKCAADPRDETGKQRRKSPIKTYVDRVIGLAVTSL
jgi:hypothetical protein